MWSTFRTTQQDERTFIERARRAQIADAAVAVIATLGYQRASLDQIAKHAGISKGVISYHFSGKDDLMQQIVLDVSVAGAAFMDPLIEAARPHGAAAMVQAYLEANLAYIDQHRHVIAAVMQIILNLRATDGRLVFANADTSPTLERLEQIFRHGQATGEFRDFDPTTMAVTVRAAIDAAAGRLADYPGLDATAYAGELVATFSAAVTRQPPGETG